MKPELHWKVMVVAMALVSANASTGATAERDPFRPPPALSCAPAAVPPPAWRLRGIIGRGADFHAWLVYAGGRWEQRRPEALLDAHRRLLKIDALSITVEALQGCKPSWKIMLKGKRYDQDDMPATAAQSQAASRQPGSAVAGVR